MRSMNLVFDDSLVLLFNAKFAEDSAKDAENPSLRALRITLRPLRLRLVIGRLQRTPHGRTIRRTTYCFLRWTGRR